MYLVKKDIQTLKLAQKVAKVFKYVIWNEVNVAGITAGYFCTGDRRNLAHKTAW